MSFGFTLSQAGERNPGAIDRGRFFQDDALASPADPCLVECHSILGNGHQPNTRQCKRREEIFKPLPAVPPGLPHDLLTVQAEEIEGQPMES